MKTTKLIYIFYAIVIHNLCLSQSLSIKGFIKNAQNEKIVANYKLLCNKEIVLSNHKKKIKIDLLLDKEYMLIISKIGYESKIILFSTYTEVQNDFNFEFDLCLLEDHTVKKSALMNEVIAGRVYYDSEIKSFNAVVNKNTNH